MSKKISRADFLKASATGLAAMTVVPNNVMGAALGHKAPSDKLNIAGVGVGGRGAGVLKGLEGENIVALCDTDWKYAKGTFDRYSKAQRFWDWREMYDKIGNQIDAVMCATPDHSHAIVSATAMELGKHVYCEKPLTHSVYESRLLTKMAAHTGVATQMGNQGSSDDGVRLVCDWIWNGEIGEVTRVDTFTDRPIWPQGLMRPTTVDPVPETLNWDLFIGPAKFRPYNQVYQPWNWRGWWDFGTGALGDMACHILHPVFKALQLGYPTKVEGSSTALLTDCAPQAQKVKIVFPARQNKLDQKVKVKFPEVTVNWYDGGLLPERPEGLDPGINLNDAGGACIFYGTKDILICGCYGRNPYLVSGRVPKAPSRARKVELTHYEDWVRACKEDKATRLPSISDFAEAGPFNEMVVMGVLGVRLQSLNKTLEWDGEKMEFTNIGPDETLRIMVEDGFSVVDGHPTFNKTYTDPINAQEFAREMIKHNYREGWKLPNMPK
ncbi:MAG: Gfo/Idh/MocA family oxidoreductase [Rikenellaceae bacterium]|nr:Gfo/Idh/MocA family oxidoreductase [Rikenellaceae bacterium]MBQ3204605.1 Gfo/Idh/MocA family oxidoreductase [Alistipes sp.]MBR2014359.1 Gfo/Idh/MocA family oxidoreductase [Alistipes sp.]